MNIPGLDRGTKILRTKHVAGSSSIMLLLGGGREKSCTCKDVP